MIFTTEQKRQMARIHLEKRQRARTDLFYLANVILAPPDSRIMVPHAHGIIVDHCQKFKGCKEQIDPETMRVTRSEPICSMWELEGAKDDLILVSRGHLKTTIQTVAHCIQWIINYPDVRILICTSTDDKAQLIVGKIKQHFQFNPRFRFLFPEFCPPAKKVSDWGSKTEIIVPNATRHDEPTIMTASVGKALASTHHDVIKCSDVVTENNVGTVGQIQDVKDFFGYLEPLRERGESVNGEPNPAWCSIEGTIYDWNDYHANILDSLKTDSAMNWKVTHQSCWLDKDKRIPLWPERFPAKELDRIQAKIGLQLFSSQYELNPVPPGTGLATREQIRFFDSRRVKELIPRYRITTTVDLADMNQNATGDYTVFNVAGRDSEGKLDVLSLQRGHYSLYQTVELFFMIQALYPTNIKFKVQKDHFARVLEPVMQREMAKRAKWLWIEYIPISTSVSKVQRIQGLQPWFAMNLMRFSDAIDCKTELIDEILRFPKGAHDDILDTLADHMQNADGKADDVVPRGTTADERIVRDYGFNPYADTYETSMNDHYSEVGV